jgi:RNA polymerase sigma-70 factor (ECF subfamily)
MKIDFYSEEDILKACKKENRFYQEILYRKYAKKMYGICLSYVSERNLAQDVLQESFIKVFEKIKDFKSEGSLEGWIRRIITNTAIDHLRGKKRMQNYISDHVEITESVNETDGYINLKTQDILKQVSRLPDGARVVFNLYAVEGYTHKEIAKKLNISEGTSKSQFSRARKLLMSWLDKISA